MFSPPHNWCDRKCERCPLSEGCQVHLQTSRRRWAHEQRGEDPDHPEIAMADLTATLRQACDLAETALADIGVTREEVEAELQAGTVRFPTSLDAARLLKVGRDYSCAAIEILQAVDSVDGAGGAEERVGEAMLVGAKLARISSHLETLIVVPDLDGSTWAWDMAPNLLLIERVDADLAETIEGMLCDRPDLDRGAWEEARGDFSRAVARLVDRVGPEERGAIEELVRRREAPSPFCLKPEPSQGISR